jgi:hypothetical protein
VADLVAGDLDRRARDRGQVDPPARLAVGARERAELADDRRDALGPAVGFVEELDQRLDARRVARAFRELSRDPVEVQHQVGEGIVDLVRDAGGHRPDRGEAIGLDELRLEGLPGADVAGHRDDGGPAFEVARAAARLELHDRPIGPARVVDGRREAPALEDELLARPEALPFGGQEPLADVEAVEVLDPREAEHLRVRRVRVDELPLADDPERLRRDLHEPAKLRLRPRLGPLGLDARRHVDDEGEDHRPPFHRRGARRHLDDRVPAVGADDRELVRALAELARRAPREPLPDEGLVLGRDERERVGREELVDRPAEDLRGRLVDVDAAGLGSADQGDGDPDPGPMCRLEDGLTEGTHVHVRGHLPGAFGHFAHNRRRTRTASSRGASTRARRLYGERRGKP